MTVNATPAPNGENISAFLKRLRQRHSFRPNHKDGRLLDEQTWTYLQLDQQRLRAELAEARQSQDKSRLASLHRRIARYYVIENFFFYLAEQGRSTALAAITPQLIENFLQAECSLTVENQAIQVIIQRNQRGRIRLYKNELEAFFNRAEQAQVLRQNPITFLLKKPTRLEPRTPSAQIQADCVAFKIYLQQRVESNLLSPGTADRLYRHLCTLLHDAEVLHAANPQWPTELDDVFAEPCWIVAWLQNLKNRSICTPSEVLLNNSLKAYLFSVRHVWLFLKAQRRVSSDYYTDLKEMLRLEQDPLWLSSRKAQVIEALSEVEEETVLHCITYLSSNPVLQLRDTALFITALETTLRGDGLNSMRLENFAQLAPGLWICRVRAKRSGVKNGASMDRLADGQAEWRDWYMSPRAMAAIGHYLQAMGRTWQSQGPVWLAGSGCPLSYNRQKEVIRHWLKVAGCKFTRPHVLRHTGIDRLVNKYRLPIPIVQAISQHTSAQVLLQVYGKPSQSEAFRQVSQLFPAGAKDQASLEKAIISTGAKLNALSAEIGQGAQEGHAFTEADVADLLVKLSRYLGRLADFAGYKATAAGVLLSLEDYIQLDLVLQSLDLSVAQILSYEPRPQRPLIINPMGRQPKILLRE